MTPFTAVVLAGDRKPDDPVARAAGVSCKALTPVGGVPMVLRVLEALGASAEVGARILCGPPRSVIEGSAELQAGIEQRQFRWLPNQPTPSASAYAAMQSLPGTELVLLTTADHALLDQAMVDHFCARARASGDDLVVAVALYEHVKRAYPGVRRTAIRLQDAAYSGCNLFAFMTPRARSAADFWRQVENQRKKPRQVIVGALGWVAVARYLVGRLSLNEALGKMSRRLGIRIGYVVMPFAEAAIDVDTVADWSFVQSIVNGTLAERSG